jgi:y4mF family transcriptional regulator
VDLDRDIRTPASLGAALRARRTDLGLTQGAVARQAKVSLRWLIAVEAGKPTADFGRILAVIDVLGLRMRLLDRVAASRDARGGRDLAVDRAAAGDPRHGSSDDRDDDADRDLVSTPLVDLDALLRDIGLDR